MQNVNTFQRNFNAPDIIDVLTRLFGAPRRRRRERQQTITEGEATVDGTQQRRQTRRRRYNKK